MLGKEYLKRKLGVDFIALEELIVVRCQGEFEGDGLMIEGEGASGIFK